ncbi:hypothetical protein FIBSPDRAFT_1051840, partial [Athelia psychrophila]
MANGRRHPIRRCGSMELRGAVKLSYALPSSKKFAQNVQQSPALPAHISFSTVEMHRPTCLSMINSF